MPDMPVTIKDIARVAGVSHTTVSRALRDHPSISALTTEKIKQLAHEMGYVPNTAARHLKTDQSKVLGIVVRRIDDIFFAEVLQGVEEKLQTEEYSFVLATSQRDPVREKSIVQAFSEQRVDGVILCSAQVTAAQRQQLKQFNVPVVHVNNWTSEQTDYSIQHDDVQAAAEMTRHLLALGHTRIAYMNNMIADKSGEDRKQGYQQALSEAGIPYKDELVVNAPNGKLEGGSKGAEAFLELQPRPTALFCYCDMMAFGVLKTLHDAGWRVPEDCSVVGFDNIQLSAFSIPALTTFHQPKYELGYRAAEMMLSLLRNKNEHNRQPASEPNILKILGQVVLRDSTAEPNPNTLAKNIHS